MAEIVHAEGKGRGKHKKKSPKKMSTRIDLTPMVDLGFLLITFFMLTTTFSKPQTMEINMPVKNDKDSTFVKESKAITVILGEDNKLFWYTGTTEGAKPEDVELSNYSKDGIRKILIEKNHTIQDFTVLIKAVDKSKYKNVVDIFDEMNITAVKRYALVDITPEDLELIKNL